MRILVGGISNSSNVVPLNGISNAQSHSDIQNIRIMETRDAISGFSYRMVFWKCEDPMDQVEHLECSRIMIEAL